MKALAENHYKALQIEWAFRKRKKRLQTLPHSDILNHWDLWQYPICVLNSKYWFSAPAKKSSHLTSKMLYVLSWKWQPTPISLPGKSREQRSLVGYSSGRGRELDMTENTHTQCLRWSFPQLCHLSLNKKLSTVKQSSRLVPASWEGLSSKWAGQIWIAWRCFCLTLPNFNIKALMWP